MDILVRQGFTDADAKKADLTRAEWRKGRFTSDVTNLLNHIDCKRSIILCDEHARKFNGRVHQYKRHPNRSLYRVIGNCDVCQQRTLGLFFVHESEWLVAMKQEEKWKRAREYATLVG